MTRAATRGARVAALALLGACGASPASTGGAPPEAARGESASDGRGGARDGGAPSPAPASPAPRLDCLRDDECRHDARLGLCAAEPTWMRPPALRDQGVLCYCDEVRQTCARLRVEPIPCEGDHDCAVAVRPRPHPVRVRPGEPRPAPCVGAPLRAVCARTNVCTLAAC